MKMTSSRYYLSSLAITVLLSGCGGGSSNDTSNASTDVPEATQATTDPQPSVDVKTSCSKQKEQAKSIDANIDIAFDENTNTLSLSSSASIYDQASDTLQWDVYLVSDSGEEEPSLQYTLVASAYSDEDLAYILNTLPSDTYQFKLTIENSVGVVDHQSEYLSFTNPANPQAAKLGFIGRFVLGRFISALSSGIFNYLVEEHVPCDTQARINEEIVPRLQAIRDDFDNAADDIERELGNGLEAIGVDEDHARRISAFLVDVFF